MSVCLSVCLSVSRLGLTRLDYLLVRMLDFTQQHDEQSQTNRQTNKEGMRKAPLVARVVFSHSLRVLWSPLHYPLCFLAILHLVLYYIELNCFTLVTRPLLFYCARHTFTDCPV